MPMDLATWMIRNDVVDQQLADTIDKTRSYVNRVRNGDVHPSLGVALAIWDFTNREIPIEQLLPRAQRPKLKQRSLPSRPRGRPRKPPARSTSGSLAAA